MKRYLIAVSGLVALSLYGCGGGMGPAQVANRTSVPSAQSTEEPSKAQADQSENAPPVVAEPVAASESTTGGDEKDIEISRAGATFSSQFRRVTFPSSWNLLRAGQQVTVTGEIWGNTSRGWIPFEKVNVGFRFRDRANNILFAAPIQKSGKNGVFSFTASVPGSIWNGIPARTKRIGITLELYYDGQGNVRGVSDKAGRTVGR